MMNSKLSVSEFWADMTTEDKPSSRVSPFERIVCNFPPMKNIPVKIPYIKELPPFIPQEYEKRCEFVDPIIVFLNEGQQGELPPEPFPDTPFTPIKDMYLLRGMHIDILVCAEPVIFATTLKKLLPFEKHILKSGDYLLGRYGTYRAALQMKTSKEDIQRSTKYWKSLNFFAASQVVQQDFTMIA
jgi:hypothetical protein